jgi:hypothetical protein
VLDLAAGPVRGVICKSRPSPIWSNGKKGSRRHAALGLLAHTRAVLAPRVMSPGSETAMIRSLQTGILELLAEHHPHGPP